MKIKTLTNSILAVSAVALSGSAQAYDTAGIDLTGTAQYELHTILWQSPQWGEKGCPTANAAGTGPSLCVVQGGAGIESSTVFSIENQWFVDGNRTAPLATSPSAGNGGAVVPNPLPVAECYTAAAASANFTALDGAFDGTNFTYTNATAAATVGQGEMRLLYAFSHRPQALGAAPTYGAYSRSVIDGPGDYQVCTNIEGKIVSGGAVAYTNVPDVANPPGTINVAAYYSFTQRAGMIGLLCSSTPTVADMESTIADFEAGTHTIGTPVNGASGCVSSGWTEVSYLNCDSDSTDSVCGELQKAVPVPAFAAAALGLGLFGITYLTARRRAVK